MRRTIGIVGLSLLNLMAFGQIGSLSSSNTIESNALATQQWVQSTEPEKPAFFKTLGLSFGPGFSHLARGYGKANHHSESNDKWFLTYPNSRIGFGASVIGEHQLGHGRFNVRSELNLLYQNQLAHYKRESLDGNIQTINYYKYNLSTLHLQVPLMFGVEVGNKEDALFSFHLGAGFNAMLASKADGESLQYVYRMIGDSSTVALNQTRFDHQVSRVFGTFHYVIGAHFTINERPVRLEFAGSSVLSNLLKQPSYSSRSMSIRIFIPFNSFF